MHKLQAGGVIGATFLAVILTLQAFALPSANAPLVAHEWGTFTSLQDDDGTALGAINADDEPVPEFVHRIGWFRTLAPHAFLRPETNSKGLVHCHPDVTMRLETPVIYFYPPAGGRTAPVNVRVTFRGGWLTEFYPNAQAEAPDLTKAQTDYPPLASTTSGSLTWNGVELNASGPVVSTNDPVWTAPREVERAAVINVPTSKEQIGSPDAPEKFLFYRGVGHVNSPLRVVRDARTDRLSLYADPSAVDPHWSSSTATDLHVPAAWLIEIRPEDGFCAFRVVPSDLNLGAPAGQSLATLPASFSSNEFGANRLQILRGEMQQALVAAGLFPDEAAAMLKTWELSYFKSPGRRLFYITPRDWTDQVLPLAIDGAQVNRAMMGRIELITPKQRELLTHLAAGPCPDLLALKQDYARVVSAKLQEWESRRAQSAEAWKAPTLEEAKIELPPLYQDYLKLGRFRDALILREQQQRPTPALAEFIQGDELGSVRR